MDSKKTFLGKVPSLVEEGLSTDNPLIKFTHPSDLEAILDLDVREPSSDEQLERCVRQVLKHAVKTNRSNFRNQLYGGTDPYGLAGAWIAEAFNTSQYTFEVAPSFTIIENKMLRHMLQLFGLQDGDGIFSPGGSISNMYAMVAARYRSFPNIKSKGMHCLPPLVVFTSDDSHYSIRKGAHWLGIGTDNIYFIKTNNKGQMIVEELEKAITEVKEQGKHPLIVNATAGTTVLGAFDGLERIGELCKKYGVWMHVDACWGGSLILSEKHRHNLQGIHKADSIAWNPHKMLGAPLQCSAFLIRHPLLLHSANSASANYLFQQDKFYDVHYDTGDKSVQCGRKVDSFKLWLMWKARGDSGLAQLVDSAVASANHFLSILRGKPGFKLVVDEVQCTNVCFWYIPEIMRGCNESPAWWEKIHKVTSKIKEQLTLSSQLMVCYTPLHDRKNFFRMTFTCHPIVTREQISDMVEALIQSGDSVDLQSL